MKPRPIIALCNGILTGQGSLSWVDNCATWLERSGVEATSLRKEYFAPPTPYRNLYRKNPRLARGLAAEIEQLCEGQERPVHLIAHSNGTHIALKTAQLLAARDIPVATLIVLGSVLRPSIFTNGVLGLMQSEMLERAVCYWSGSDKVLFLFGRGGWRLGYSDLGRRGFQLDGADVNTIQAFVPHNDLSRRDQGADCYNREFPGYDHGDYFSAEHRENTFNLFRKDMNL